MKAAVLHRPGGPLQIEDLEIAKPASGEVRVRVVASGLCHSDYHFITGSRSCRLPVVLGHEVSGIVQAVGENVEGPGPGDAVIVSVPACGACVECLAGHPQRCDDRPSRACPPRLTLRGEPILQFVEIGGFAEAVLVDHRSVTRAPEGVPLDLAALFGCAVISGFGAVTRCAGVRPGQSVAIIGCGGVGLNIVQASRISGARRIVAIDVSAEKRELARRLGATEVVCGGPDAAEQVAELTGGGVDFAFEAVGLTETIGQAIAMLRKGGAAVLVGIPRAGTMAPLPTDLIFRKELRILSTISGSLALGQAIGMLAEHYRAGRLLLEPLVDKRIGLSEINQGFDALRQGGVGRSLITFGQAPQ